MTQQYTRIDPLLTHTALEGLPLAPAGNYQTWGFMVVSDGTRAIFYDALTARDLGVALQEGARQQPTLNRHMLVRHADAEASWGDAILEMPWAGVPAFHQNLHIWVEHLPRNSALFPGMVAYYASVAHRVAGRLTPAKPGRYLSKFFGHLLTQPEIEALAHVWAAAFAPMPLNVTQDADEIEQVYTHGPNSCMSGTSGEYHGSVHPSRVYAGPDLAVAYIGEPDDAKGRAVVWTEKMIWTRTYGDTRRMEAALTLAGYRKGTHGAFEGARLQRIKDGPRSFVMPYVDVCGCVDDDGEFMILTRDGEYAAEETNGLCGDARPRCAECGDDYDEDYEGTYIEDVGTLCDCCVERNYFFCHGSEENVPNSESASLADCSDHRGTFSEDFLRGSDYWHLCEGTDEWFHENDECPIGLNDGRTVSEGWADSNAFRCEAQDEWIEIETKHTRDETGKRISTVKNWVELDNGEAVDRFFFNSAFELAEWLHEEGRRAGYSTCDREALNALLDLWAEQDDEAEEDAPLALAA